MIDKKKMGRNSRIRGKRFENEVYDWLSEQGYVVTRWTNTIIDGKIVPQKPKYNPFLKRIMSSQTGFPDYLAFISRGGGYVFPMGIECKSGQPYLDKKEREMVQAYKEKHTFDKIMVACKKDGKIMLKEV